MICPLHGSKCEMFNRFRRLSVLNDECWIYLNQTDRAKVYYNGTHMSLSKAVFLHVGNTVKNNVLHTCDIYNCWNPNHLYDGTQKQNIQDMIHRGRRYRISLKGAKNPSSKLKEKDVLRIRELRGEGMKLKDIAYMFGIDQSLVSMIALRKVWKHV